MNSTEIAPIARFAEQLATLNRKITDFYNTLSPAGPDGTAIGEAIDQLDRAGEILEYIARYGSVAATRPEAPTR